MEVIGRNISPTIADMVAFTILTRNNVIKFDPHFKFNLIKTDPDDDKFVDCAIVAGENVL